MLSAYKMSQNSFHFEDARSGSSMISATKTGALSWKEENYSAATGKNSEVKQNSFISPYFIAIIN